MRHLRDHHPCRSLRVQCDRPRSLRHHLRMASPYRMRSRTHPPMPSCSMPPAIGQQRQPQRLRTRSHAARDAPHAKTSKVGGTTPAKHAPCHGKPPRHVSCCAVCRCLLPPHALGTFRCPWRKLAATVGLWQPSCPHGSDRAPGVRLFLTRGRANAHHCHGGAVASMGICPPRVDEKKVGGQSQKKERQQPADCSHAQSEVFTATATATPAPSPRRPLPLHLRARGSLFRARLMARLLASKVKATATPTPTATPTATPQSSGDEGRSQPRSRARARSGAEVRNFPSRGLVLALNVL